MTDRRDDLALPDRAQGCVDLVIIGAQPHTAQPIIGGGKAQLAAFGIFREAEQRDPEVLLAAADHRIGQLCAEHRGDVARFDSCATVDDHDLLDAIGDQCEVVGDQDEGRSRLAPSA